MSSRGHGEAGRPCRRLPPAVYLLLLLSLLSNVRCRSGPGVPTGRLLNAAELRWNDHPVPSYLIVVDVERPGERRRNTIRVDEGEVAQATTRYWNTSNNQWDAPRDLRPDQAYPFTVPGLLETARTEIRRGSHAEVRIETSQSPPFIRRISLSPGPTRSGSGPATEATILVVRFEQQTSAPRATDAVCD